MTTGTIKHSQRTAVKVAGLTLLFSMVWFKSNYIPKGLALFGLISSAWCVICAFVFLVFPGFAKPVGSLLVRFADGRFRNGIGFLASVQRIEASRAQSSAGSCDLNFSPMINRLLPR